MLEVITNEVVSGNQIVSPILIEWNHVRIHYVAHTKEYILALQWIFLFQCFLHSTLWCHLPFR